MRFDYWTVSVVPRPMGITTIGVGVIVIDAATGQSQYRFRTDRGIHHGSEYRDAIRSALRSFTSDLDRLATPAESLNLDGVHSLPSYLQFVSGHWQNLIRVDPKQSMDARNLTEATDLLFTTLIGESLAGQKQGGVRKV